MRFLDALRSQARSNELLGSPFTAHLLRIIATHIRPNTQAACEKALDKAGESATKNAPLARLSMEADGGKGAVLTL